MLEIGFSGEERFRRVHTPVMFLVRLCVFLTDHSDKSQSILTSVCDLRLIGRNQKAGVSPKNGTTN